MQKSYSCYYYPPFFSSKRYSLQWTNGDESLQAIHRYFNGDNLEDMLSRIKEMIRLLPPFMGQIIKFGCLVGLRPSEVVESVRLINNDNNIAGWVGTAVSILQPRTPMLRTLSLPRDISETNKEGLHFFCNA
jgi:hypothetical protein